MQVEVAEEEVEAVLQFEMKDPPLKVSNLLMIPRKKNVGVDLKFG